MELNITVAISDNGVIGKNGNDLWNMPAHLERSGQLTKKADRIVIGRATHDFKVARLRKQIPKRETIVITGNRNYIARTGYKVAHSFEDAINSINNSEQVFVIGGAEMYRLAMPYADRIYVTRLHTEIDSDILFPEISSSEWKIVSKASSYRNNLNPYDYSFEVHERRELRKNIMTNKGSTKFTNPNASHNPKLRSLLEGYQKNGICPFCPEHLLPDHTREILKTGHYWLITHNAWPLPHTKHHFLLILHKRHVDDIGDLTPEEWSELLDHYRYLKAKFQIQGCGFFIQSGDITKNKSSIAHTHVEIAESDNCDEHEEVHVTLG